MDKISDILKDLTPVEQETLKKESRRPYSPKKTKRAYSNDVFDFLELIKNWELIVGATMVKHTIPLKNSRGVLTILSDHPGFSEQLKFLELPLIKKIKENFPKLQGKIKTLKFQVHPTFFKETFEKAKKRNPEKKAPVKIHKYDPNKEVNQKKVAQIVGEQDDQEIKDLLSSLVLQAESSK